jgi:hypothetical protein
MAVPHAVVRVEAALDEVDIIIAAKILVRRMAAPAAVLHLAAQLTAPFLARWVVVEPEWVEGAAIPLAMATPQRRAAFDGRGARQQIAVVVDWGELESFDVPVTVLADGAAERGVARQTPAVSSRHRPQLARGCSTLY